ASMPVIDRFARFGLIDAKREQREVADIFHRIAYCRCNFVWFEVTGLSAPFNLNPNSEVGQRQRDILACQLGRHPEAGLESGTGDWTSY
ncbi:MAG TPA: hypothetical protein VIV12_16845, partial [Streptosporangiaceae bacterium]